LKIKKQLEHEQFLKSQEELKKTLVENPLLEMLKNKTQTLMDSDNADSSNIRKIADTSSTICDENGSPDKYNENRNDIIPTKPKRDYILAKRMTDLILRHETEFFEFNHSIGHDKLNLKYKTEDKEGKYLLLEDFLK